jgi:hypothetical protein
LSRGRVANHVFTAEAALTRDTGSDLDVPRFALLDGSDPTDVLGALAQRFRTRRTQTLALAQRPAIEPAPYLAPHSRTDDIDLSL